jgi:hypothetical protein
VLAERECIVTDFTSRLKSVIRKVLEKIGGVYGGVLRGESRDID